MSFTWSPTNGTLFINKGFFRFFYPEITFVFPEPDPVPIDPAKNKILIHKYGGVTDSYPPQQTSDGEIQIEGKITDGVGTTPVNGIPVYLRIIDPQDPSSYIIQNPNYDPFVDHDNKGGLAILVGPDVQTTNTPGVWKVVSKNINGQDGRFVATLQLPGFGSNTNGEPPAGGDNYRIQASLTEDFSFVPTSSGTISTWKRVYIEQDKMFKKGALLFNSYDQNTCGSNCDKIKVYGWSNVAKNDIITFFEPNNPVGPNSERRKVTKVVDDGAPNFTYTITFSNGRNPAKLTKSYCAADSDPADPLYPKFLNGCSAAVGVESLGFYEADKDALGQAMGNAEGYVEFPSTSLGEGPIPYLSKGFFSFAIPIARWARFHQIWFTNKTPDGTSPVLEGEVCLNCYNMPQNSIHLLGVSDTFRPYGGATNSRSDFSFVFYEPIQREVATYCSGPCDASQKLNNYIEDTTAHELAHQFSVNESGIAPCPPATDPAFGHDKNLAWCGNNEAGTFGNCRPVEEACQGTEVCTLNIDTSTSSAWSFCQRSNGVVKLDCSDLAATFCPGVVQQCGGPPPDPPISIRTMSDPQ